MQKWFRLICVAVLFMGSVSFSLAWKKRQNDFEPVRPYVAVYFEAETTPEGKMTINRWRTEYVKPNGEFRTVMHGSDAAAAFANDPTAFSGTNSPVYGKTKDGGFIKGTNSQDRKALDNITASEEREKLWHSHSYLKSSHQFDRMDKVAGLDVYVMHLPTPDPQQPEYWTEYSYSASTGRHPLRIVIHQNDGTVFTVEAVKVEFRDVPDDLNGDIQALPSTGNFGEKSPPSKKPNSN